MTAGLTMGIDVGTYSSKGVLCSADGTIHAEHQIEHGLSVPKPGWAEHDADAVWWVDVCAISKALLSAAGVTGDDVRAIAVSGLGPDLVPLDAQGRALRPAILYGIDTRSVREIDYLNETYGADAMADLAGMYLTTQAIGPKILWLRRNEPEIFSQTRYLCSASSFLVYGLSGEYMLDYHSASHFNPLFDIRNLRWDARYADEIIGAVPLPRLAWPAEVVGQVTAKAAEATGLKPGTPVTCGTIDAVSEAISIGVVRPGDLMMMYGTTTFFILVLDEPTPSEAMWMTAYAFPGLYNLAAGMATTGALTRWFRDNFAQKELLEQDQGGPNVYALLTKEAEAVPPGSQGLVMLPYFSGERTPLNDPQARGLVAGLSLAHGRGHLYRAVLEATAYGVAHNMEVMRNVGAPIRRAVAVGGGTKSALQLQIVSDVTGMEQELPAQTIGASYGDAFIAALATEMVAIDELDQHWVKAGRRVIPDDTRHRIYEDYYQVYRDLYPRTRKNLHRLADLGA